MITDGTILGIVGTIFVAVSAMVFLLARAFDRERRIRSRVEQISAENMRHAKSTSDIKRDRFLSRVDERALGIDPEMRSKLHRQLIRAGFFSVDNVKRLIVIKTILTLLLPLAGYFVCVWYSTWSSMSIFFICFVLLIIGFFGPDSVIERRAGWLQDRYRQLFPDMLDLLQVCSEAGLSFTASLRRIGHEFETVSPEFSTNIAILNAEITAGSSAVNSLGNFADRLGIDEARSFALLLSQSQELGTDIGSALETFSDEMRDMRYTRAEEKANKLPVKMLIPLGLFVFPVLMIYIMTPPMLKIGDMFKELLSR